MTAMLLYLNVCNIGGLMKKKNIRNIVGFCVLVPIITGVLVFLSVVATIGLDHLSIKWDIDNPHVDRHFSEWKKVSISGLDDFRIPEAWALKQEAENVYCIYDEARQIWGHGAFYTQGDESPYPYGRTLERLLSIPITGISFEDFIPIYMMNGSDVGTIIVQSDDTTQSYQEIRFFVTMEKSFIWILEHDISIDEQQFAIAEAILYSYSFHN